MNQIGSYSCRRNLAGDVRIYVSEGGSTVSHFALPGRRFESRLEAVLTIQDARVCAFNFGSTCWPAAAAASQQWFGDPAAALAEWLKAIAAPLVSADLRDRHSRIFTWETDDVIERSPWLLSQHL